MAKVCTKATNIFKFFMACSDGLDLALGAGVAGFGFSAGVGRIYTWSSEGATGSGVLGWDCGAGNGSM